MGTAGAAATRATFGIAFMVLAGSAVLADWKAFASWVTPVAGWGYLFLVDALVEQRSSRSFFARDPARFLGWVALSVAFCVVSRASLLWLRHGAGVGLLPGDRPLRLAGVVASFAAVLPGLLLTTAALAALGLFRRVRCRPWRPSDRTLRHGVVTGILCLSLPALLPQGIREYLFALIVVGMLLILEPINHRIGAPSILADLARGEPGRAIRLLLAGYIWGGLLAFWNSEAMALWVDAAPLPPPVGMFEIPVAGVLATGPIALEAYAMYNTFLGLWRKARGRAAGADPPGGITL